jgi:hypothetical protein
LMSIVIAFSLTNEGSLANEGGWVKSGLLASHAKSEFSSRR